MYQTNYGPGNVTLRSTDHVPVVLLWTINTTVLVWEEGREKRRLVALDRTRLAAESVVAQERRLASDLENSWINTNLSRVNVATLRCSVYSTSVNHKPIQPRHKTVSLWHCHTIFTARKTNTFYPISRNHSKQRWVMQSNLINKTIHWTFRAHCRWIDTHTQWM